jgi:hypothetical protein
MLLKEPCLQGNEGETLRQQNHGFSDRVVAWVKRKIFLYNVTTGLYMLDWWERYLFSILFLSPSPLPSPLTSKMHVNILCCCVNWDLKEMKAQPSYIQLDRSCQTSENCPQLCFVHCSYLRSSLKVTRSLFWKSHRRIFDVHALGLSEVFLFFTNSSCSCLHN